MSLTSEDLLDQYRSLFSTDAEGRLLEVEETTRADLERDVTLFIDGRRVTVKQATPVRDDRGAVRTDENGLVVPRPTTIYEAAIKLFHLDGASGGPPPLVLSPVNGQDAGGEGPIPVLCHQEHMKPVAV